jgi:four helix bundle protein
MAIGRLNDRIGECRIERLNVCGNCHDVEAPGLQQLQRDTGNRTNFTPLCEPGLGTSFAIVSGMTPDELIARTKAFARDVALFAAPLFCRRPTENAADQLTRASSSVAANYRACCRSRSHAEFTAKIGLVAEEADESAGWLEHLRDCGFVDRVAVAPLVQEAQELTRILGGSYATARKREEAERRSRGSRPLRPRPR